MTATLPARTAKIGQRRHRDPEKTYVECPVCGVPTSSFESVGFSTQVVMYPAASGYEDGARCKAHARSLKLRTEQTEKALAIALWRLAPTGQPAPDQWVAIDDMCQGTE